MTIRLERRDELAPTTGQLSQSLMVMTFQSGLAQQAAIDKVDQAAAPIIEALEKKLQSLAEQNADVQRQLALSLAKEAELDQAEELCVKRHDPSHAKRERDSWLQKYEDHFANFNRQSAVARVALAKSSPSYADRWARENPGFFEVRRQFP